MTSLFLKLVNMSIPASWMVVAVIAVRLLLKKTPKVIHCMLWALVAIRLICPISFESSFSLMPAKTELTKESFQFEEVTPSPHVEYGIVHSDPGLSGEAASSEIVMRVNHVGAPFSAILLPYLTAIWISGVIFLLIYAADSWLRLRRRVTPSVCIGNDVWLCDHIDTPFILGFFRPRIYLPSMMKSRDADYVLAHERAHLKRRDHWWKPLGFLLLAVYWFNPVMWLAYILLCRDVELACDEQVVKNMDLPEKKAYSTALLDCSLPRRWVTACPLAFGEVGVKQRVKNILRYKKPAFWVFLISILVCIVMGFCLLTDPSEIHLYEINDSRNYSDLLTNTDNITFLFEGNEMDVSDPDAVISALRAITVREMPLNRTRSENRDSSYQIQLRKNTYLNFSKNFTKVWIDNGLKPTYTYRVNQPQAVIDIFTTYQNPENYVLPIQQENSNVDTSALDGIAKIYYGNEVIICNEFEARNISFFDPHIIGNTMLVGVRYGNGELGAAWFGGSRYGFRIHDGRTFDEFFPTNTENVCSVNFNTEDGDFTVYLCTDDQVTAALSGTSVPDSSQEIRYIPHSGNRIPIVLNTGAITVSPEIPTSPEEDFLTLQWAQELDASDVQYIELSSENTGIHGFELLDHVEEIASAVAHINQSGGAFLEEIPVTGGNYRTMYTVVLKNGTKQVIGMENDRYLFIGDAYFLPDESWLNAWPEPVSVYPPEDAASEEIPQIATLKKETTRKIPTDYPYQPNALEQLRDALLDSENPQDSHARFLERIDKLNSRG